MAPLDEALLDRVRAGMRGLEPPGHRDRVHKEECMFSFDTPFSPGGLYVNLKTFQGFGADFVSLDHERTGATLYLHETWTKVPLEGEADASGVAPTKLAIGVEGGFNTEGPRTAVVKEHALALLPGGERVPLPCPELPELVIRVADGVIAHESVTAQEAVAAWEEERRVSKYAEALEQLDSGRRISPRPQDWKCDDTGVTENLWLNLSTGHIGSGRQNWDGSGGNGSALCHYEATGRRYPLVVKLGTITPSGADVYSYAPDEDDMVLDPKLRQHLARWGINMAAMEKTEKTMAELQVDLNMRFEFDAITEAGAALVPLSGPGHVGLVNLGNSCYMNSCLQVLFGLPEVAPRYVLPAPGIFRSAPPDAANDLLTQLAKVGVALVDGRTGAPPPPATPMDDDGAPTPGATADAGAAAAAAAANGGAAAAGGGAASGATKTESVRPLAFKALVGKGHPEFSSARQQDAAEYWGHLLELAARAEHAGRSRVGLGADDALLPGLFSFALEDRTQCLETGAVSYKQATTTQLALHVPLEAAVNAAAVEQYKERQSKRQKLKDSSAAAYIGAAPLEGAEGSGGTGTGVSVVTASEGGSDEAPVLPVVPFEAVLAKWAAAEVLDDYRSAAAGGRRVQATRRSRFASFPPYLTLVVKRYFVAEDWTPKKLEVEVPLPDTLDLERLRSGGPAAGEMLQPDEDEGAGTGTQQQSGGGNGSGNGGSGEQAAAAPDPDAGIVAALVSMGFSENGSKRAALATNNSGAEAATEWVFAHMEDADFNDPLPAPGTATGGASAGGDSTAADPEAIGNLTAMGFGQDAAATALAACGGSLERAADWLFSHMDDLDSAVAAAKAAVAGGASSGATQTAGSAPAAKLQDGPGRYRLVGIVSHMGSSTACGHYVAHVFKDGRWVIFNDEKVAASEAPPRSFGYMYLYARQDTVAAQQAAAAAVVAAG